ncbi:putative reverse transcriptase domain-containing protein [Tanacetum coccineum]
MRQRRWLELLSDYNYEIRYHPRKANVVADALSRKERVKPLQVRALVMTIRLNLPMQILNAQAEARKEENYESEDLTLIMHESHKSKYSIHPGSDKMVRGAEISEAYGFIGSTKIHAMEVGNITSVDFVTKFQRRPTGQTMNLGWDGHLPLVEFSYNNSYHTSIKAAPFEALYSRKFRSPICWAKVRDSQLSGSEIGKLNPRYIGPFKILTKVRTVAYQLELLEQLNRVHSTFHVSNLKKCLSDETQVIPLDEIQIDDKLRFIEEHVEIMDHEVKCLKQSRIRSLRFIGTRGYVPNSPGNVRTSSRRNTRIYLQNL